MKKEIEFVVHADDYGISTSVNDCVRTCFHRGWISETSLMVNMPGCEDAIAKAESDGYAHLVGLHFNLTEGHPLSSAILQCPRFCDSEGNFNGLYRKSAMGRFFLSKTEQIAVKEEIKAQLQKFRSYDGLMNGINSHHHIHTDWSIYKLLKPLAIQYGFTRMRLSADLHRVRIDKAVYKSFFNADCRRHFNVTRHFGGVGSVMNSSSHLQGGGGYNRGYDSSVA